MISRHKRSKKSLSLWWYPIIKGLKRAYLLNNTPLVTPHWMTLSILLFHNWKHLILWRELPQVSFLLRQKFCCDKRWTYACCDKTFDVTKLCLSQQNICHDKHNRVTTNFCCCDKHNFVTTKVLLWHAYFCHDKKCVCHDRSFLATKLILVAAPSNDIWDPLKQSIKYNTQYAS